MHNSDSAPLCIFIKIQSLITCRKLSELRVSLSAEVRIVLCCTCSTGGCQHEAKAGRPNTAAAAPARHTMCLTTQPHTALPFCYAHRSDLTSAPPVLLRIERDAACIHLTPTGTHFCYKPVLRANCYSISKGIPWMVPRDGGGLYHVTAGLPTSKFFLSVQNIVNDCVNNHC